MTGDKIGGISTNINKKMLFYLVLCIIYTIFAASLIKKGMNMNTITIDNKLYNEAILYAGKKQMSVAGLFESAVRNFMDLHPIKSKQSVLDSVEYKRALEAMDELMADEQTVSVPVDEDGRDARIAKYIL